MFPLKFLMDNSLYFFLFATYSYQILNRLINFRKEKERKFIQSQIYSSLSMQCFYITSGSHLELEYVGAQYWWGTWGSLNGRFAVHPGTEGVIILCTSLENLSESQTAAEVVLLKLYGESSKDRMHRLLLFLKEKTWEFYIWNVCCRN